MPPKTEEKAGSSSMDQESRSMRSLLDEELDRISLSPKKVRHYKKLKYIRIGILTAFWLLFTTILIITKENDKKMKSIFVPVGKDKEYSISKEQIQKHNSLSICVKGPFLNTLGDILARSTFPGETESLAEDDRNSKKYLYINARHRFKTETGEYKTESISKQWRLILRRSEDFLTSVYRSRYNSFQLTPITNNGEYFLSFTMENVKEPLPLLLKVYAGEIKTTMSVILSCLIFIGLYIMLFWDVTSRTVLGLIFCSLAIALTGLYHTRLKLSEMAEYVTIDYIMQLMGLTIIFGVFAETGGDLYVAVQVFRLSRGHLWPMLTCLLLITAAGSAFFDQIMTVMFVTLFALRICEIQSLTPASVLTCIILFSNIGHMLTPIGIIQFTVFAQNGIKDSNYKFKTFFPFVLHMLIPVLFSLVITYCYLRLYYRNTKSMQIVEAPIVSRLRHAIRFWSHTAKTLGEYSEVEKSVQENVKERVNRLRSRLRRLGKMPIPSEDFDEKLQRLQEKHKLKNKHQVIMCAVIVVVVILMKLTFYYELHFLSNGWTCILLALVLLALASWHDFESLMRKMDWSTILLVICIMIITKSIAPLGMLSAMSNLVVEKISNLDQAHQLYVGIIIITCVSAFASIFLDNSYVLTTMTAAVTDLINTSDTNLKIDPLMLAVMLGAGLGCNVTLISSIANIVCAGLAEKHDYKFYFWDFFKVGAVVTCLNIIMSIVYVLLFALVLHHFY